jgi:large subunit ribosomal protein L18
MAKVQESFLRRRARTRNRLRRRGAGRPRLSIFRSDKHIYAQIIDDGKQSTVAAASSLEKDLRAKLKSGSNKQAAGEVGRIIAERALAKGIKEVIFDRGGYRYHGRVKALADAAREGGLKF